MQISEKTRGFAPSAFRHRNFRLFCGGQLVSLVGTQMQMAALGWLAYDITNSPFYLGLLNCIATLPILLLSMFGGILADRMNKRRLLLLLQFLLLLQAVALALVVHSKHYNIGILIALAAVMGAIVAFEAPTRQSFVSEMVPQKDILSAIALNSTIFNGTRVLGPMAAGFLIPIWGEAGCFYINAVSFLAVIVAIYMMRDKDLYPPAEYDQKPAMTELKDAFRYIRGERQIMALLGTLMVASIFGMPAMVMMPVFAKILNVGPIGMGVLYGSMGTGSFISAITLVFTRNARRQGSRIVKMTFLFSASIIAFSLSRNYLFSIVFVGFAGLGLVGAMAMINGAIQTITPTHLRGRVMAVYVIVFLGMMPFSNLFMGVAAEHLGAPRAILAAGILCAVGLVLILTRFPGILKIDTPVESAPVAI